MNVLTIYTDGLLALIGENGEIVARGIRTRAELDQACRVHGGAVCSSSIDFPEEETQNEDVIATCRSL